MVASCEAFDFQFDVVVHPVHCPHEVAIDDRAAVNLHEGRWQLREQLLERGANEPVYFIGYHARVFGVRLEEHHIVHVREANLMPGGDVKPFKLCPLILSLGFAQGAQCIPLRGRDAVSQCLQLGDHLGQPGRVQRLEHVVDGVAGASWLSSRFFHLYCEPRDSPISSATACTLAGRVKRAITAGSLASGTNSRDRPTTRVRCESSTLTRADSNDRQG